MKNKKHSKIIGDYDNQKSKHLEKLANQLLKKHEINDKLRSNKISKDILDLLNSLQVNSQIPNPQLQQITNQIQTLVNDQQQTQDTITKKLIEPEFIQIPKPNYAARIIK
jgi:uncharacterized membrane-anchored protein YjiN (DUF445 family)